MIQTTNYIYTSITTKMEIVKLNKDYICECGAECKNQSGLTRHKISKKCCIWGQKDISGTDDDDTVSNFSTKIGVYRKNPLKLEKINDFNIINEKENNSELSLINNKLNQIDNFLSKTFKDEISEKFNECITKDKIFKDLSDKKTEDALNMQKEKLISQTNYLDKILENQLVIIDSINKIEKISIDHQDIIKKVDFLITCHNNIYNLLEAISQRNIDTTPKKYSFIDYIYYFFKPSQYKKNEYDRLTGENNL